MAVGPVNFPWIFQTPSVNFPWNLAHFKNSIVKSRIFSRELGWSLQVGIKLPPQSESRGFMQWQCPSVCLFVCQSLKTHCSALLGCTHHGCLRCLLGHPVNMDYSLLAVNSYRHCLRCLCSADTTTLQVPSTRRATLGDRAFSVAAARVWNSLPPQTRACSSLLTFRRETKSHFLRQSYGWLCRRLHWAVQQF